ncbi:MAG: rod shape-determining protein MreD [Actinomycetota bacterium]|nr:rod shape-determining protein MreD [Actinomycetota bacterium]
MRRTPPTTAAILVAMVLQVAIAPHIAIGGVVPNMFLLVVVTLAFVEGPAAGATSGFFAGLLFDLLGTAPVGPGALVLAVAGFIAGALHAQMFAEGWRLPLSVLFITSLSAEVAYGVVLSVLGAGGTFWQTFTHVMVPGAVYNAVLAILVYPWLARFLRRDRQMTTFSRLG